MNDPFHASDPPSHRTRALVKVGDKLTTHNFNTGTRGFVAPEDCTTAVCILPGTELAFSREVMCASSGMLGWKTRTINSTTAIFRQINKDEPRVHHDALEFPDGPMFLRRTCVRVSRQRCFSLRRSRRRQLRRRPDARRLRRLTFDGSHN